MPRVDSGGSVGRVHVPGVYQALLEKEREHHYWYGETVVRDGCELQVSYVDPNDHFAGFFCRSRHLLDALEAGEPVRCRGGNSVAIRFLMSGSAT